MLGFKVFLYRFDQEEFEILSKLLFFVLNKLVFKRLFFYYFYNKI